MSMDTSIIYGYGFHSDCEDAKLWQFIKNHSDAFLKNRKELDLYVKLESAEQSGSLPDMYHFFENYECDASGVSGVGSVIANIMSRETGIRFIACLADDTCDTSAAVLLPEHMPWLYTEREKTLTGSDFLQICKQYAKELGISEEPDYLRQEYYG